MIDMKYLFTEPCDYLNKEKYMRTEQAFLDRYDAYLSEYAVAEPLLPKGFVKEYKKDFFHDYEVAEMAFCPGKKGLSLNLTLNNYGDDELLLSYQNVRSVRTQLNGEDGFLKVLYVEILPKGENTLSQEFSFWPEEASLYFTFSSLRFKKRKHI